MVTAVRNTLRLTTNLGVAAVFAVSILIPQTLHAAWGDITDPTGRGWECQMGGGGIGGGTICRNPENNSQNWKQVCRERAGTTYCVADSNGNTSGEYIPSSNVSFDPVTGMPSGEGVQVINTRPLAREIVDDTINTAGSLVKNGLLAVVLSPVAVISFLILSISTFLLWLAGTLFNWAVVYLVFDFGTWFGNSPGLLLAWQILRDFGNILLLYGFVYMGIATILDLHNYTVKKALPNLVIFAVLLNFSLFVTEAIIDTSNVLASTLYNQTYSTACEEQNQSREDCVYRTGISSQIIQQAGIGAAFSSGNMAAQQSALNIDEGNYITNPVGETLKFFGLALLVTTAAVVLFAGALLLIARAIHLGMLMVTSPIGFAGMAVPPLQKIANDWWTQLINQALFAPVFLLLLFVALKITEGLQALRNGETGLGEAISAGGATDTGPLLLFALVIGFMIAALLTAKRFGVYGADIVTSNALNVIKGTAGTASFGVWGWGGRRTFGVVGNVATRAIRRSALGDTDIGRVLAGMTNKVATTSYDGRSMIGIKDLGSVRKEAKGGIVGVTHEQEEQKKKWDKEVKKDRKLEYEELEQREEFFKRQKATELANGTPATSAKIADLDAKIREAADKVHAHPEHTKAAKDKELKAAQKQEQAANKSVGDAEKRAFDISMRLATAVREGNADLVEKLTKDKEKNDQDLAAKRAAAKSLKDAADKLQKELHAMSSKYADNLEETAEFLKYVPLTIGKRLNRIVSLEIREEMKKSKDAKLLDMIKEAGGGKKDDDHGGGHAPAGPAHPPTAPSGGSGGGGGGGPDHGGDHH